MSSLRVETWPIDRLREYEGNPRENDAQVSRMVEAIREFGFRIPIVAKSDGLVIDGHLRLKAAREAGLKEVPVALADELSDVQIKQFRLLANRSANWAAWDDAALKVELADIRSLGGDLGLTGFDASELEDLLAPPDEEGEGDPNAIPDEEPFAVTGMGEVWLLGAKVTCPKCGKSTPAATALRRKEDR